MKEQKISLFINKNSIFPNSLMSSLLSKIFESRILFVCFDSPIKNFLFDKKAFALSERIYEITKKFPNTEGFGLISQMQRSGVSVVANIAEGSQRTTDKDFARFILIAKGSLAELETYLLLSQKLQYGNPEKLISALSLATEIGKNAVFTPAHTLSLAFPLEPLPAYILNIFLYYHLNNLSIEPLKNEHSKNKYYIYTALL